MRLERGWWVGVLLLLALLPLSIWAEVTIIRYIAGGCQ